MDWHGRPLAFWLVWRRSSPLTVHLPQAPWADNTYRLRRPITVQNPSATGFAAGDMVAFSYIPQYGAFANQDSNTGKDVKVYYYNGTANVDLPQVLLPMGTASAKVLFPVQATLPAPVYVTETPGGSTGYGTLPGTVVTPTNINGDDGGLTVTLPFQFPFGSTTTDQVFFSIDGYLAPGTGQPLSQYGAGNVLKPGIYPYASDYTVSASGGPSRREPLLLRGRDPRRVPVGGRGVRHAERHRQIRGDPVPGRHCPVCVQQYGDPTLGGCRRCRSVWRSVLRPRARLCGPRHHSLPLRQLPRPRRTSATTRTFC